MTKIPQRNSTLKADTDRPLTRRKGLGASGGGRKRSGFTQPAGYSYESFCLGIADLHGADCYVRRHVRLEPGGEYPPHPTLAEILNDPRNGIACCRRHHDLLENARIALTADVLPGCVFEFAAELGDRALARLERDYGERTER